jgi:hypothetical protein
MFSFFFSVLLFSEIDDHQQEKLAKFGYRLERGKIKKVEESCNILTTC